MNSETPGDDSLRGGGSPGLRTKTAGQALAVTCGWRCALQRRYPREEQGANPLRTPCARPPCFLKSFGAWFPEWEALTGRYGTKPKKGGQGAMPLGAILLGAIPLGAIPLGAILLGATPLRAMPLRAMPLGAMPVGTLRV